MTDLQMKDIERIIESVLCQCSGAEKAYSSGSAVGRVKAETSAKHVHLDRESLDFLFGKGYKLTPKRNLSQPGQFLCEERVKLVTPKGELSSVAVLGPVRDRTQVELSYSDAKVLGLEPPLRLSGCLQGAADVIIVGPMGALNAKESTIIAKAHVHMTAKEAESFNVSDGERISAMLEGPRPVTFNDVIVRVSDSAGLALHIDCDEGNAAMFSGQGTAVLLRTAAGHQPEPLPAANLPAPCSLVKTAGKGKNLITEKDAREMVSASILKPPADAILTPAAKDVFSSAARKASGKEERGS